MAKLFLYFVAAKYMLAAHAEIVLEIHVVVSHFTNGVFDNKHRHHHEIEVQL